MFTISSHGCPCHDTAQHSFQFIYVMLSIVTTMAGVVADTLNPHVYMYYYNFILLLLNMHLISLLQLYNTKSKVVNECMYAANFTKLED